MSEDALFPPLGAYDIPAFDGLDRASFGPAFDAAMAAHRAEIDAIADAPEPPTFANTIAAMERAGEAIERTASSFYALAGADTDDTIQAIEREVAPKLSRHSSAIALNAKLFARIDAVFSRKDDLTGEDRRLVERVHIGFVRGGAKLEGEARERLAAVNARLSELGTAFSQNVLADEKSFVLPLTADDLAGLPDFVVSGMREAARERGIDGYALTLSRSIVVPFLTFSDRRDLREAAFKAWIARGENEGPTDNRQIIKETLELRAEKARLLGYDTYAAYKLDDTMAKTPSAVRALLTEVWEQAVTRAGRDATALAGIVATGGANEPLEPWDWRYYAEKRRRAEFAIDEAALKPYFQLERMIEAAFDVASRLFGLSFERLPDAKAWRPEVRVWRVRNRDGREVGLFLGDYFARSSKRSGAWMSALRDQHKLEGSHQTPIIYNVMNFAKPAEGQPALLSMDDARTLFHEFGHALHGLLSDVTWPRLSGTSVSRDFVELPSQLFEHWLTVPDILQRHALHAETGEPLPPDLAAKLERARTFDAGFDAVEYTASALVDLALHESGEAPADPAAREAEILAELKLPREIVMRHRSPHFAHIFAGEGYSAGYYSYMWSEVLDADAFDAFTETGDPFDPKTAALLLANVYAAGGTKDPAELYQAFRGRMPTSAALLRKRGFAA
ncbi:M3 family metallopeptidase [Aureimonas leprariae]|uniref:M3 family metallopeptidase n=1 Tax=Plantimonas leprariae TaxID=2615207 RepID=A0A7V7PR81_9HYPH|nr:M3 family metallopeptidase [Aureimonas leprariae]KAB0681229.1 M3 family metallopeptidase [Aureimonas leprariae]